MIQTVPLCPDHRHQIVAPRHQFGQFHPFGRGGRGRLQLQRPAHPRQHFSIDPVGFGQLAGRAGIFPGVARVDAGKVGFEPGQRLGQRSLVTARGFQHNETAFRALGKPRKGLFCHGNPLRLRGGEVKYVNPVFGNIDADDILWQSHDPVLVLRDQPFMRPCPGQLFRFKTDGRRAPSCETGCKPKDA